MSAWTTGATAAAVAVKLRATPAKSGTPEFSFGCGSADGTASCDLGAVDPQSAHRQLQAQLTIPVTASAVKSVSLTVTGTATHLPRAATASATVVITAPRAPATRQPSPTRPPAPAKPPTPVTAPLPPIRVIAPLPVGPLPGIPPASPPGIPSAGPPSIPSAGLPGIPPAGLAPVPTQTQSGNASNLFPTLTPAPGATGGAGARRVADTSALPEGAPVVGGQLAGLAALALALVFTATRLSIRRPAKQTAADSGPDDGGNHDEPAAPGA